MHVSIEVDPTLAGDAQATIAQAMHLHEAIARRNLLVKSRPRMPARRRSRR
jgi:transaldolase